MRLENDFDKEEKEAILTEYGYCWKCGSHRGVSLHHILKRVSASILNAFALCGDCHDHVTHSDVERSFFIRITFKYVMQLFAGKLKKRDELFILQNPQYYQFLLRDQTQRKT